MARFIARIVVNAIALWGAAYLIPDILFTGTEKTLVINILIVALVFGLVNAIIKPVLTLVTCPIYMLTLGLFTFIMNALMLLFTAWVAGDIFQVNGFWAAFLGSIIISIISFFMSLFINEDKKSKRKKRRSRS